MKHKYFSVLIVPADNQPTALFKVNCLLLGKEDTEVHLMGHAEEVTDFLEDNIIHLHSQLDARMVAGPVKACGAGFCPVIWEWFEPAATEGVDRILGSVCASICPSWLVKTSWEVTCR